LNSGRQNLDKLDLRDTLVLLSKRFEKGLERRFGGAVRRHGKCGDDGERGACDDHGGGIILLLQVRQEFEGKVHDGSIVDLKVAVDSVEIEFFRLSELQLALGA
jgi:hypothetical protein